MDGQEPDPPVHGTEMTYEEFVAEIDRVFREDPELAAELERMMVEDPMVDECY